MDSLYYNKQHEEGISPNPVGSNSSGSGRWWPGHTAQSGHQESPNGSKNSSSDHSVPKEDMTLFNVFHGESKGSTNGRKSGQLQDAFTLQSSPQVFGGHLELGFGQPAMVCGDGKYPRGDQCYGVFSAYGPQIAGRIMLPLNLSTDEGPIFVNAKQYNGIIRRRRSRAKAEMTKKATKNRKPYMHLSRHLHAKRRPRGCGGRFLNSKEKKTLKTGILDSKPTDHPTGFQRSEVLYCDRETNRDRPNVSRSEVTSTGMFSMGDLNHFPIGNLSGASLSEIMVSGNAFQGFGMQNKWVVAGAGDGIRCNLTV